MKHFWALALLVIILAACTPQPQSGDVLLVDDFSNPESGFTRQADADAIMDYVDGQYQIQLFTPNINVWASIEQKITDSVIEVNAHTAAGSDNNLYGVICRREDDSNFYFFAISADGYYAIGKLKESEIVLLGTGVFEKSDIIKMGQEQNHIRAECNGQTLTLIVNGTQLLQTNDADFTEGGIGLIAGTFGDPETEVRFDDLLVLKP
jgi:hypothetical protein